MKTVTIGSVVDNYRILEKIGQGGMGVVFKALNVNLDKIVAIKTITLGLGNEEYFTHRFRTEARALAKLENPNIVNIYDLRAGDNQWFIIMEYIEGVTLVEKIQEHQSISWQLALPIFKQILRAIGHAHRLGIIHRDIKPNNVMITPDGVVKVTDFGLAKDQQHVAGHTLTSSTGGTLYYMSPEQVKGLLYTDYRSDIYSLGLTFYEMLSGQIPFRKDDTDFNIREAIVRRKFPPPTHYNPKIPEELSQLVMKSIEKEPEARFQSVDEIFIVIEEFERSQGLTPTPIYNANPAEAIKLQKEYAANAPRRPINPAEKISNIKKIIYALSIVLLLSILTITGTTQILYNYILDIMGFVPNASLTIETIPDEATIFINDDSLGVTPIKDFNLRAGKISIQISKTDFFSKDTILLLEAEKSEQLSFNLIPAAFVLLEVIPKDAEVIIDDISTTIVDQSFLCLPAGKHTIHITHQDYEAVNEVFELFQGTNPNLQYSLSKKEFSVSVSPPKQNFEITDHKPPAEIPRLEPLIGSLSVTTNPSDATITVDGQEVTDKKTPVLLENLIVGTHELVLNKKGFEAIFKKIDIQADLTTDINVDLTAAYGDLQVQAKPWANIYIDGSLRQKETNLIYSEQLTCQEHLIKVEHQSLGTWEKAVQISPREITKIDIDFNKFFNLVVTAFDQDNKAVFADIFVDDQNINKVTPQTINLRLGLHRISVQKEGYILTSGEKLVLLEENLNKSLKFILKKIIN